MNSGRLLVLLPLALSMTAACGDVRAPTDGDPAADGAWGAQRLEAQVGADQAPLLATDAEDALVLTVSEEGTLRSHLSAGGEAFEPGEPLATNEEFLMLGGVVPLADGGWLAVGSGGSERVDGDTEMSHDAVAFRSTDGLVWDRVDVSGFADPVDVDALTVLDGTIVAAGAYRTADDPSMGGFEAHVWTSTDGSTFTEVDLPGVLPPRGYRNESYAGHVTVVGDRLLAAGRVDRSSSVWTSDDAGSSWQQVDDPVLRDTYAVSGLAVVGDVVLAGAGEGEVAALRSTDGGESWSPVERLPVAGEEGGWAPVWSDGTRFWTLTGVDDTSWSSPEVCYADLGQCGQSPGPRTVTSEDGAAWTAVAVPGEPDGITGTADGRALVLGVEGHGVVVHTLPSGTAPPPAPLADEPETVELVTLEEGERPEVGVRYHAPMYVHCGMDWFWFGDGTWRRTDDGPDVETGAGDEGPGGWPLVGQVLYGYATLIDADHLEYSFDDGVVATYRRADGAPGCA